MIAQGWGAAGKWLWLLVGMGVSIWSDGNALESDSGDGHTAL